MLVPGVSGPERKFTSFPFQMKTLGNLVWGTHWLLTLSLPGIAIAFLYPENWLAFLPADTWELFVLVYGGSSTIRPQNIVGQKCGLHPICSLPTVASFSGNCPSTSFFWLSLGVTGSREGSSSWCLFSTARNSHCPVSNLVLGGWSPWYLSGCNPVIQSYFLFHKLSLWRPEKVHLSFLLIRTSPLSHKAYKSESSPVMSNP